MIMANISWVLICDVYNDIYYVLGRVLCIFMNYCICNFLNIPVQLVLSSPLAEKETEAQS
jgi:hypothetical protein